MLCRRCRKTKCRLQRHVSALAQSTANSTTAFSHAGSLNALKPYIIVVHLSPYMRVWPSKRTTPIMNGYPKAVWRKYSEVWRRQASRCHMRHGNGMTVGIDMDASNQVFCVGAGRRLRVSRVRTIRMRSNKRTNSGAQEKISDHFHLVGKWIGNPFPQCGLNRSVYLKKNSNIDTQHTMMVPLRFPWFAVALAFFVQLYSKSGTLGPSRWSTTF